METIENITVTTDNAAIVAAVRQAMPESVAAWESLALAKHGQFCSVESKRLCNVRKGAPEIHKHSKVSFRTGIEYGAQARVIAKHESGEVERRGLHDSDIKLSKVLVFNLNTKKFRIGFAPIPGSVARKSEYYMGDKLITKAEALPYLLASETRSSETPCDWITFNPNDIISIT